MFIFVYHKALCSLIYITLYEHWHNNHYIPENYSTISAFCCLHTPTATKTNPHSNHSPIKPQKLSYSIFQMCQKLIWFSYIWRKDQSHIIKYFKDFLLVVVGSLKFHNRKHSFNFDCVQYSRRFLQLCMEIVSDVKKPESPLR